MRHEGAGSETNRRRDELRVRVERCNRLPTDRLERFPMIRIANSPRARTPKPNSLSGLSISLACGGPVGRKLVPFSISRLFTHRQFFKNAIAGRGGYWLKVAGRARLLRRCAVLLSLPSVGALFMSAECMLTVSSMCECVLPVDIIFIAFQHFYRRLTVGLLQPSADFIWSSEC